MFHSCRLPLALGLSLAVTGCGLVEVKTSAGAGAPSSTSPSGHAAKASVHGSAGSTSTASSDGTGASPQKSADYNTVTARFPELTDADALDLAKVKSAIDRATPDMFYTANDTPAPKYASYYYFADGVGPKPGDDVDALANEDTVGTPDAPYAVSWGRNGNLYLAQRNVQPQRLAANTAILIWRFDTKKQGALVVTLDGGLYWTNGLKLPLASGFPQGAMPPPVQHDVLTAKHVRSLEAANQFPHGTAQAIDDARATAEQCSSKLWDARFAAKDKANQLADVMPITRENRANEIHQQWADATVTTCAREKKQFETAILAAIATRRAARKALYDDVVAKATRVASGH